MYINIENMTSITQEKSMINSMRLLTYDVRFNNRINHLHLSSEPFHYLCILHENRVSTAQILVGLSSCYCWLTAILWAIHNYAQYTYSNEFESWRGLWFRYFPVYDNLKLTVQRFTNIEKRNPLIRHETVSQFFFMLCFVTLCVIII